MFLGFFECIWLYGDVCVCVQLRMCKCGGYGRVHGYICEGKCTCVRVCAHVWKRVCKTECGRECVCCLCRSFRVSGSGRQPRWVRT